MVSERPQSLVTPWYSRGLSMPVPDSHGTGSGLTSATNPQTVCLDVGGH